ncbi:MAG TPA: DNA topoisomerase (ATP-hydrolyzing) subunit B [Fervidobacterium sp.]|nr:DNA topoisomerase (ATP-hydrolyzing) subunit B [Fervidobacterium sp.]HOK87864.1 DNA topoisomerase (ATP-hydrolyzing) subunit B [Fervidobacterium sp.]HOM74412.1 DNA topoisomerase (ATP-hydrolyzing) subunit B [Fervidobacterium sp.]HOQ39718.1 DNA topoisomerase (ATP-hydrolyzing) subunit B [Fervidobacterium sp.]HPP18268.1 DNA topoisomerase (ATP-hydrolyzing) subunit B [Fervidobacterium sp.]
MSTDDVLNEITAGEYNAENIQVLKGLEPVRQRPGMYIGSTGKNGLHHLVYEIVDNSIDEVIQGYCDKIRVVVKEDGTVEVEDNGRGIPVDVHPETGVSALEVVMSTLHAGGKFSKETYKVSGGLHGVGASVVNALSEWMEVEVHRYGKIYRQQYSRGIKTTEVEVVGKTEKRGTVVRFRPDPMIFTTTEFDADTLLSRLRDLAFLNPNVTIEFIDERNDVQKTLHYAGGIKEFVSYLNKGSKTLHDVLLIEGTYQDTEVHIAVQYTDDEDEEIVSFVNNIKTVDGGTHVTGFKTAFTRVVNDLGKKKNLIKGDPFRGEDLREGMTAVINVLMMGIPQFEGQTKSKLGNEEVQEAVAKVIKDSLTDCFEVNESALKVIIQKAQQAREAREAAKHAREAVRRKNALGASTLPGKLADCITKNIEEAELFIVEGDSAGGSAKQARDRNYQAILPLRGKILNVEKSNELKLLKNEQIRDIITAIGSGTGDNFDLSKLRYGKIVIMTDADVDGAHIRTLLLALFYRYMRHLLEEQRIYIAMPPLYKITVSGEKPVYLYSDEELKEKLASIDGKRYDIQRYKGLGEMNPDQLWETTMNPESRKIMRVQIEDAEEADNLFQILMGKDPEERRGYIMRHAKQLSLLDLDV